MLRKVAVIALPDVAVFELGVLCELFGYDRTADGLPGYDFALCSPDGRPVRTHAGFSVSPEHDLVIVWRWHGGNVAEFGKRVIAAIR